MKNNGNFKNAGSSRAKTWRNILLILGAVALIASYIADIRDPHPGTETQDNRPFVEQALKDGFTVTDWSYALEGYDGGGVKIKHTHTSIDDLCPAEQDAE